ncbi:MULTISPECIES: FxsB family cyclophane-forming radical SAM/SPASM peptide maturase [Actinokineospora]|uniref:Radical SAM protein n=1 Tax=Actinokineospora fastidiosa TaxID=1816 RepID=A0A918GQY8_9PSEU|nr:MULTISPECIES: FxsB family cyclophane-forming radical SAM/SPASM peptide maturase [Actinokineospora]UVS81217.1 Anaerobic sulfatase-maturating enzyme [Actinokineospora sp. UTMC 2448]GGS52129.1 radical SAM protein [Actinokineospora fastidiosa]
MTGALRQFVMKVHGRCDLACDYCYVFTGADQRWRGRPPAMSAETAAAAVTRIAEHVRAHALDSVEIVLHGGEPLLAGPAFIDFLAADARARIPAAVRITAQTNGMRLDRAFLELFGEHGIRVGISVDGDAAAHDRHRRTARGRGSHDRVRAAVDLVSGPEFRDLFAGLLCVVDLANDPVDTYRALAAFDPPAIDFLLPHGTWAAPPPGRAGGGTPYADWLIAVFDHWYADPGPGVRFFDAVTALWLGGGSLVEGLGTDASPQVVIETDGTLERSDILAVAYPGAGATGLSVHTDPLDAVLPLPVSPPSSTCVACPVFAVCGGGQPAHRYAPGTGFDNPSVYCPDLLRFTTHVRSRIAAGLGGPR